MLLVQWCTHKFDDYCIHYTKPQMKTVEAHGQGT